MKLSNVIAAGAILALSATGAQAVGIVGSLALAGINVTQNGANLGASTSVSAQFSVVTSPGSGSYAPIPLFANFGSATVNLASPATGFGFSLSNASYGSFTPISGTIVSQTSEFLDVFIIGTFTPGPGLAPADEATPTTLRISVNQSGSSLSEAITLNSPYVPPTPGVPDSAPTLGLAVLGLSAIAAARRALPRG